MQAVSSLDPAAPKAVFYQQLCIQLEQLLGHEKNFMANAANACALIFQEMRDINWAGFYLADGADLVLGPFQGKPACVRIPFGKGVCGTAAVERRTLVVANVHDFTGHIACDYASQSEIVVPLLNWGRLLGVLDIDSPTLNRFDDEDRDGIESLVSVFVALQATNLPDLNERTAHI